MISAMLPMPGVRDKGHIIHTLLVLPALSAVLLCHEATKDIARKAVQRGRSILFVPDLWFHDAECLFCSSRFVMEPRFFLTRAVRLKPQACAFLKIKCNASANGP